jgi:hypothetical protein
MKSPIRPADSKDADTNQQRPGSRFKIQPKHRVEKTDYLKLVLHRLEAAVLGIPHQIKRERKIHKTSWSRARIVSAQQHGRNMHTS